ncbi:MAG: hypothetical protein DMF60_12070 [Acidobacteria bacterium]|nr:MAG: hypothetical protein DMF60_12070 [Acidobacteriota bacterium]
MGTVFCDNCGVSLLEETAKFCRACGKPTPLSEAATKRFDQQPGYQTPTSPVGPAPTTPAYMAPIEFATAPQTIDLNRKRKRNIILIASMLSLMIFALAGLLIFLNFEGTPTLTPPVLSGPTGPGPPPMPPPMSPPPPPPPPVIETPTRIDQSLIYPGSRQTMSSTQEGGTNVLTLHSEDAASKVAKWYAAKLKVTANVSLAGQTFLKAGDITVMVMGGDGGAEILLTQGSKDSRR